MLHLNIGNMLIQVPFHVEPNIMRRHGIENETETETAYSTSEYCRCSINCVHSDNNLTACIPKP